MILLSSRREITLIREANQIVASVLQSVERIIDDGVTTKDIDEFVESSIRKLGGMPAFKGYHGFPAAACVSVNEELVHGIPTPKRRLKSGDIVSVDVGVELSGYYGDAARTWGVGKISDSARRLIEIAEKAFFTGIESLKAGARLGELSFAIQSFVESNGYSVIREYVGHGIGRALHEDPPVPNFGSRFDGPIVKDGMVLAVEPMISEGGYAVKTLDDGWTVITKDGSLTAHYENTIAVVNGKAEVLSLYG